MKTNCKTLFIGVLYFLLGLGNTSAQSAFLDDITRAGYDSLTVNDLSTSAKVKIKTQPTLAYVNVTGIDRFPTRKISNYHASIEVYDGNGNYFKKRIIINAQGNSSLNFVKKNFSVDFFEDDGESEADITIGKWVKQDGFHLKAYYLDVLRGTGAVGYKMYDRIVAGHPTFLERAGKKQENERCYPDGFPCLLYLGGDFYGIYAWQLKKHRKNYGMDKKSSTEIHIDGALGNFWKGNVDWTQFEIRNPKELYTSDGTPYDGDSPRALICTTDSAYMADSLDAETMERTIAVREALLQASGYKAMLDTISNDAEQKAAFDACFDKTSLIDYFIFSLLTANYDGFDKNYQWLTYDGKKWHVAPYDLDGTFGMFWKGYFAFPAEWTHHICDYRMEYYTKIFPFSYMCKYYWDELKDRYCALRKDGQISASSFNALLTEWHDHVGEENYQREWEKWPDTPCKQDAIISSSWTTVDDWSNIYYTPQYNDTVLYHVGDKCSYDSRIWTCTADVQGECPWSNPDYQDTLDRITAWMTKRIALEDEHLGYDEKTAIVSPSDDNRTNLPVGIYTINGQKVDRMIPGMNIVVSDDGHTRKVLNKFGRVE